MSASERQAAPESSSPELAVCLLCEPLLVGKQVLVVGPLAASAGAHLGRARAENVTMIDGVDRRLDRPDGSVDVALCLAGLGSLASDVERHRWLGEIHRVLKPRGFAVLRVPGGVRVAPVPGRRVVGKRAAGMSQAALEDLVRHHFTTIEVVSERQFRGVAFTVPGVEDVAVNEQLTSLAALGGHGAFHVAFATAARERVWSLGESLLVPMADAVTELDDDRQGGGHNAGADRAEVAEQLARLETQVRELSGERDELRETLMQTQDQNDTRDAALAALRKETARHLEQIAGDAGALELAGIARDAADRRAMEAEQRLASVTSELKQREAACKGLERELAKLRKKA